MAPAPGFHYAEQGGPRMSPRQVMALARKYGLPARGVMQIARGESGLRPKVQQHDPGDGMVGYGLLQMTPNAWGKGSAAYRYMQSLGGVRAMADPDKNMAMARFLYKAAGNSFKPWYGTKFLTDRSGEGSLGPVKAGTGGTPRLGLDLNALKTAAATAQTAARAQPQVTAPQAPSFAAGIATPAGYQAPSSSTAPAAQTGRFDLSEALRAVHNAATTGNPLSIKGGGGAGGGGGGGAGYTSSGAKGSKVLELIYNNGGAGFGIKDGRVVDAPQVYAGVWGGHRNHVHVAAGPQTVVALGKLAQRMGLHVGENPHFGGVDPVHVAGSYHYKGEAIDVSGANHLMSRFAKAVERYNRTHQLPA
jgi:hypothetical protein